MRLTDEEVLGKRFGKLTIESFSHKERSGKIWNCICECGGTKCVSYSDLNSGKVKSCGCLTAVEDVIGKKFGSLTVISLSHKSKYGRVFNCVDDDGNYCQRIYTRLKNEKVKPTKQEKVVKQEKIKKEKKQREKQEVIKPEKIFNDLTGKRINELTVLGIDYSTGRLKWLCLCDCGKETLVSSNSLTTKKQKTCGCSSKRLNSQNKTWKGYGEISGLYWASLRSHAQIRGYKLDLTIEEAWEVFERQNGLCMYTGDKLIFPKSNKEKLAGVQTASIERLDTNVCYNKENICWIHKDLNFSRGNIPIQEFLSLAIKVSTPDISKYELIIKDYKLSNNWKGVGLLGKNYTTKLKSDAMARKITFNVDTQQLWDLFLEQNGRCYYTNIPLIMSPLTSEKRNNTASIDRVDSNIRDYSIGNIVWCHKLVNRMKQGYSKEHFIGFCKKIENNYENIKKNLAENYGILV